MQISLNLFDKKFDIMNKFLSAPPFLLMEKNIIIFRNFHLFNYTERFLLFKLLIDLNAY